MGDGYVRDQILRFLTQMEARPLRAASLACRSAIAEHEWGLEGIDLYIPHIVCRVASWRRCFPCATYAHVSVCGRRCVPRLSDADLAHLHGIHTLHIESSCALITDAGIAHLCGIHTLRMWSCPLITDAGLVHLSGIHTLHVTNCPQLSSKGLAELREGGTTIVNAAMGVWDWW